MIDLEKIEQLPTANEMLDEKYGKEGTPERIEFDAKAEAWYYATLLREERKNQHISQQQLAALIGKSRPYITALEKGQTDMQLSTFLLITHALGMKFAIARD